MADPTDRPGYSFSPGPPPEASRFLRNKGYQPAFSWQDVEPEEHAVAFTVAKATDMDVLRVIREEVQGALDEGLPFAEFQKRLRPRLEAKGWWGTGSVRDQVDGQLKAAKLGSPRRLKTIYNANIRSARSAGQWERIQRTKRALPYLTYRLGPSERHRPEHEAKEGLTLPADDPFWDEWMPQNGWGCKCWVRQITVSEAEDLGVNESPEIPRRDVENKRTGEIKSVPVGIDPGWDRNPGALRLKAAEDHLAGILLSSDAEVAKVALRDIATSWRVERMATSTLTTGNVPIAILPEEDLARAGGNSRIVEFSDVTRRHVFEEKSDRRLSDLAHLADLDTAARVAIQKRPGERTRLIYEIDSAIDERALDPYERLPLRVYVVLKGTGSFLSSFHRSPKAKWSTAVSSPYVTIVRE